MCYKCNSAMELGANDIFWQLVMEKVFVKDVLAQFTPAASSKTPLSCCDQLSHVEENAIRFTAGALLRKLEKNIRNRKPAKQPVCAQLH